MRSLRDNAAYRALNHLARTTLRLSAVAPVRLDGWNVVPQVASAQ
jgi:hypothetical protein